MKQFWKQYRIGYRLQQLFILVLHLVLLKWIFFTLNNAGAMDTLQVFYHFTGMALMGAGLIRGTAWWAQYHHNKSLE